MIQSTLTQCIFGRYSTLQAFPASRFGQNKEPGVVQFPIPERSHWGSAGLKSPIDIQLKRRLDRKRP